MLPCLEVQGARVKFFNGGLFWPEEVAGRGAGSGLKVKGSAVMQGQSHGLTGLRAWRAALYIYPWPLYSVRDLESFGTGERRGAKWVINSISHTVDGHSPLRC